MSIEQMELLFQLLIAQNSEKKVSELFPEDFVTDETAIFNDCTIGYAKYGNSLETVEIRLQRPSVLRYRYDSRSDGINVDFITWDNEVNPKYHDYEQYLQYLLKFVSFEDKL